MPANLAAKKLNAASRLTDATDRFMRGLYDAAQVAKEITSAGLTFDDTDFMNTGLAHLTADSIANAITNINAILSAMETDSRDDVLNAVRP